VVLVRGGAEVASWPLPEGPSPDLSVIDRLARLQLAARRLGCSIRLRDAPGRLRELIDLAGLSGIVTGADDLATGVTAEPAGRPAGGQEAQAPHDDQAPGQPHDGQPPGQPHDGQPAGQPHDQAADKRDG
jgi:hypothetical protein